MKEILREAAEVYRPYRRKILTVFLFITVSRAFDLASPYLQGKLVDALINKAEIRQVLVLLGAILVVSLFHIAVVQHRREMYEIKNIDLPVPDYLRSFVLKRLLQYSIGQHLNENSNIRQSVASRGESALHQLAMEALYKLLPTVIEVCLLIGVLIYFSPVIGVLVAVGISMYVSMMIFTNLHFSRDFAALDDMKNRDKRFLGEIFRNVRLVLSMAQEKRVSEEHEQTMGETRAFNEDVSLRFQHWVMARNVFSYLASFSILATGIYLAYAGKHTIGELVMIMSWSAQTFSAVNGIGRTHRRLADSWASVRSLFKMLAVQPAVTTIPNPVRPEKFEGRIEFQNLSLSYEKEDGTLHPPALKNVNLVIEAGEMVALVGESGAGKSSFVNALLRAEDPQQGRIFIDNEDLRLLDLDHYRHSVGLVDQGVALWDDSLRNNIIFGLNGQRSSVTDEELRRIAEMSGIDRFFSRLDQGFETRIGESGIKLSGGERQRVGIARALIKDPDIFIFDEATSNLDSINEGIIRESIEKAAQGRTTIIIAHRLSTIRHVKRIIVFDKGEVVAEGPHELLMETCEPYRSLIHSQVF